MKNEKEKLNAHRNGLIKMAHPGIAKSFVASYESECPVCEGITHGRGEFSTGKRLTHYRPSANELLKNIYVKCTDCGWDQWS